MAISQLTAKQCTKIKSPIVNINNYLNEIYSSFDSFNKELSPGFYLVDTFSNHFYFLSLNYKDFESLNTYWDRLDNIYKESLINQDTVLIIINTSIKNNITTLISHIYRGWEIITKIVCHTTNINSTKAKLFTIRCEISHATHLQDVNCIIVITDAIAATKWIFNTIIHSYQLQFITILKDLKKFFNKSPNNSINFWDCPESIKWSPHLLVNKESKYLKIDQILPSKSSWEFSREEKCNSIVHK